MHIPVKHKYVVSISHWHSRIKFLEARFKNKLVGPLKANLPRKISE